MVQRGTAEPSSLLLESQAYDVTALIPYLPPPPHGRREVPHVLEVGWVFDADVANRLVREAKQSHQEADVDPQHLMIDSIHVVRSVLTVGAVVVVGGDGMLIFSLLMLVYWSRLWLWWVGCSYSCG